MPNETSPAQAAGREDDGHPRVVVAESWAHLAEVLFRDSWNPELQRYRSTYAYRGAGVAGRGLRSSLSRLGGSYAEKERHLLRNFRKYARRSFIGDDSAWNWLALAQHHGLPTRLVDWTYSPFVALHFATVDTEHFDRDGEIWMVNFEEVNQELPAKLRTLLEEERANIFTGEMLSAAAPSLEELDALAKKPFTLFLEPPSIDERIVNQSALFSVMSSATERLDAWLEERPETFRKILLPAESKWEIRDKLDQANISERVLFPGLDGLSSWLRRYYTERK